MGCWSLGADEVVRLLTTASGAVALIEARRLDRALVRYEAAAERLSEGRGTTPLSVIAGVDFVVVVSGEGGPRVREVAEIAMVEDGYRPRLLFASGVPPVPSALVPVAEPSCLEELARAGFGVLVDELRHATQDLTAAAPCLPSRPAHQSTPVPAPPPRSSVARVASGATIVEAAPSPPRFDPALEDAPPPGWELDRLPEESTDPGSGGSRSTEDAALAATFGLGPPPPPPGVAPLSAENAGASTDSTTFADALKRARARDEELATNDEIEEPGR